ncbi:MAG: hypothetical protein ABR589_01810 [Chthoniobacterales bacterium]
MKKLLLAAFIFVVAFSSPASAQSKLELQPGDTIRSVLERQIGQLVELRMHSGEKLGGKLEKVTDGLVHLGQLTGAEFYDAAVDTNQIAAVSVRTKAK